MSRRRVARWAVFPAFVLVLSMLWGAALAQTPPGMSLSINRFDSQSFPDVVLDVSVADENGRAIRGIPKEKFSLQEDGNPVAVGSYDIAEVERHDPLYILLAIDASGSMEGTPIEDAKKAAQSFVDELRPDDQVAIFPFSATFPTGTVSFSSDRAALAQAIAGLKALPRGTGMTLLHDALIKAIQEINVQAPIGQRLIVVLSDGWDDGSTLKDIGRVGEEAVKRRVPLFTVVIDHNLPNEAQYLEDMVNLALDTGGQYYRVEGSQTAGLTDKFNDISDLLKWQYTVQYASALPGDGKTHTLRVELNYEGQTADAEYAFDVPIVAPIPSLAGLTDGMEVRGPVDLVAEEARGLPLAEVEFLVDSVSLGKVTSPPFAAVWETADVAPGEHRVTVRVLDAVGSRAEKTVAVRVLPAVQMTVVRPAEGDQVGRQMQVEVAVDSYYPFDRVEFRVDGLLLGQVTTPTAVVELDLSSFVNGTHLLQVRALDRGGREAADQRTVNLQAATLDPFLIGALALLLALIIVVVVVLVTRSRRRQAQAAYGAAAGSEGQTMVAPAVGAAPPPGGYPAGWPAAGYGGSDAPTRAGMPVIGGPLPGGVGDTRAGPAAGAGLGDTRAGMPAGGAGDTRVAVPVGGGRGRHEAKTELIQVLETPAAWLVIKEGASPKQFPLRGDKTLIGRSPQCDIVLGDPAISNRHAAVVKEGDTFTIQDMASSNGTFVGGQRILEPHVLQEGDEVKMGNIVMVFKKV